MEAWRGGHEDGVDGSALTMTRPRSSGSAEPGAVGVSAALIDSMPRIESLFRAHYAGVTRFVRALGISAEDADDVAQNVFVLAHRRLEDMRDIRAARSWLFGIARRVAKDHRRALARAKRRERAYAASDTTLQVAGDAGTLALGAARSDSAGQEALGQARQVAFDPAEQLARREAAAMVGSLLDRMKEEWRVVFVLAEIEGFSGPEIAENLRIKLPTVYTRLRRARRAFEEGRRRLEGESKHG